MHGMKDEVDMRLFGNLGKYMKITWVTFGLGWLAIIGFPGLSGFWSKDKIIEAAFTGDGWQPWVFGSVTLLGAGITARSEERGVGKECRTAAWRSAEKKI